MMPLFAPHPGHHGKPRRAGRDEAAPVPPLAAPVPEAPPQEPGEGTLSLSWRMSLEEAQAAVTAAGRELDGGQEQAARDFGACWPAVVTDGDDEPLPRRVPGATLPPSVPEYGSPADQVAGYLAAPERPGRDQMRQLVEAVRAWNPEAPAGTAPRAPVPAAPPAAPRHAHREPQRDPVPGAAVMLSFSRAAPTVVQPLDGLPERRSASGKPVIHLGTDPRSDGEAFAIGRMSDAWLDGLIAVLMDERSARLKATLGRGHWAGAVIHPGRRGGVSSGDSISGDQRPAPRPDGGARDDG